MEKLLLIDGNSIMNRAFYGIAGNRVLTTKDGKYTNAVYGFLAIMFKIIEDVEPKYMAVTFDLRAKTHRHEMYEQYKANRHGMPNELAEQMPLIKEVLGAMNIAIVEKAGYEGDDILGTLAKYAARRHTEVVILSGDRDTFQLTSERIKVRIPRTKAGKTETEDYDKEKVRKEYGLNPTKLIEVKGLQGDSSDNIPGVPGIGPKTAITLIKKYKTLEELYKAIEEGTDDLKGKMRQNIIDNKELAFLSRELGTIDTKVPLEETLEDLQVKEWDRKKVLEIFRELDFKRYIERFNLEDDEIKEQIKGIKDNFTVVKDETTKNIEARIKKLGKCIYFFGTEEDKSEEKILKQKIISISIFDTEKKVVYYVDNPEVQFLKNIFENEKIEKYGFEMNYTYILLKEIGIEIKNMKFDVSVAAYVLHSVDGKYPIDKLIKDYLGIDIDKYLQTQGIEKQSEQMTLFGNNEDENEEHIYRQAMYAYSVLRLSEIMKKALKENEELELFENIDMPTIKILGDMQWNGMYVEKAELEEFGRNLQEGIDSLTEEIYDMAGEKFNIKSTKQLGEILFEKLNLTVIKKTKNGYSTDVDVLEKLKSEHPIIQKILDYRLLTKLNSTFVEGLKPYINPKTKRIHSFFHQTITATGRISSTEPNLQNIPTRIEFGKRLRKVFKPEAGKVYIDADYSQIELRVLAHLSEDEHMIEAFKKGEDIHKQAASKVFGISQEEVTKEQRESAKAVNFGIVYGISDFGLGEQLGIGRKIAKQYIEQYLSEYSGVKSFMNKSVEIAKEKGYTETLFKRKREIKELTSSNYMVRQFGERAAMNTPVQGTAADIMKIAMIRIAEEIKKRQLKSKIILQVHDEVMIEAPIEESQEIKEILKECMENAVSLKVPLVIEVSEADNWYDCK